MTPWHGNRFIALTTHARERAAQRIGLTTDRDILVCVSGCVPAGPKLTAAATAWFSYRGDTLNPDTFVVWNSPADAIFLVRFWRGKVSVISAANLMTVIEKMEY